MIPKTDRAIWILLIGHICLLATAAHWDAPVTDEVAHLPAGLSHWETGNFDLYRVNPPLVRLLAAPLPMLCIQPESDWSRLPLSPLEREDFAIGKEFSRQNASHLRSIYTLARLSCIPLSVIGALVCYYWARDLYGKPAGIFALSIWCFSPNILTWGHTIIPDLGATSLGLLLFYRFYRWIDRPNNRNTFYVGLAWGLAMAAKGTWVISIFLIPTWWLISLRPKTVYGNEIDRQFFRIVASFVIGIGVLNAVYGFEGTFTQLKDYRFVSLILGDVVNVDVPKQAGNCFRGSALGEIPIPLPRNYVKGIDWIKWEYERGYKSYLRGKWQDGGWWYFYLYAICIKVPVGYLLLFVVAIGATAFNRDCRKDWFSESYLLGTGIIYLAFVSTQTGFTHHLRYVLPAFPFAFIFTSKLLIDFGNSRILNWLALVCFAMALISSLSVFPRCMSYFNELAGGPRNGYRHLLTSNVDWGQDLYRVRRWHQDHPAHRPFFYAHSNHSIDQSSFLFDFEHPPTDKELRQAIRAKGKVAFDLRPGCYAIGSGVFYRYDYLFSRAPFDFIGDTVRVFNLDESDIASIEEELRATK